MEIIVLVSRQFNFQKTGSIEDRKRTDRPKTGRSVVARSISEQPTTTTSRRPQQIGINVSTFADFIYFLVSISFFDTNYLHIYTFK